MHGLVNRAIQGFVEDTYGRERWLEVTRRVALGFTDFDTMIDYSTEQTETLLDAISIALDKPKEAALEDIGTYLVTHPNLGPLRRLLRFGGETFLDFLLSLDDLPGRARMAVPDLDVPDLQLKALGPRRYSLVCDSPLKGYGYVVLGLLRGMADDYGALVLMDIRSGQGKSEVIDIVLVDLEFSEGRSFDLARTEKGA
ncbi:Haem-NO-binding [Poseidonocella pacifica]|uniref:Haem-NO-binding n=1 Tax=Poseidonocella pacifica TaxID=871651 RepID=A0A1I0V6T6_9RHOB|nr:heme NO-binding domain-containing protein [Poseidonocella pacifica]SFA71256.1 Haem-NO-binding [Poseidonocella pacifica]